MKKYLIPILGLVISSFVFYRCVNNSKAENIRPVEIVEKAVNQQIEKNTEIEPVSEIANNQNNKNDLVNHADFATIFKTNEPINGFYGTNNYRIEYYIYSATKNIDNPNEIDIIGKTRFKKNINNFKGKFIINNVLENPLDDKTAEKDLKIHNYKVDGTWQFNEDKSEKNSGVFSGKFVADISKNINDNKIFIFEHYGSKSSIAKENGLLLKGNWTSYTDTKDVKNVAFTNNIEALGNKIFKNFIAYGERDVVINEKYAKYGWDEFYSADEWWTSEEEKKLHSQDFK